ncbi:MAG: hypothetical protein P1U56_04000 [Saprospiraceae bacterium]|nr:hypothetical protein [Saprospiraceae bacterium]
MKMQIKNLRAFGLMLLAALAISFTSCNEESFDLTDIDNFTDGTIDGLQKGVVGKRHCLEFIFPVSIEFVDGTSAEVTDYQNLHQTVRAWFEENEVEKSKENRPQLIFPLQVLNKEGEIIDVASEDELKELKSECPKIGKGKKGKKGKGFKCFSLVFPVTVTIDGTDQTFEDRMALKTAIRTYKMEAGEDFERPTLVFPVTIQYEDETQVEVADQDELQALKEACQDEEG